MVRSPPPFFKRRQSERRCSKVRAVRGGWPFYAASSGSAVVLSVAPRAEPRLLRCLRIVPCCELDGLLPWCCWLWRAVALDKANCGSRFIVPVLGKCKNAALSSSTLTRRLSCTPAREIPRHGRAIMPSPFPNPRAAAGPNGARRAMVIHERVLRPLIAFDVPFRPLRAAKRAPGGLKCRKSARALGKSA